MVHTCVNLIHEVGDERRRNNRAAVEGKHGVSCFSDNAAITHKTGFFLSGVAKYLLTGDCGGVGIL